jgi:hypothetical protein
MDRPAEAPAQALLAPRPKHRNHHELLEWLGEPYDPAAFDPDALNGLLKKLKL